MFTVLNCMPYVLAWPLNEQCNWACLKNMEQVVRSFYTAKEKGRRGIHLVPEEQVQLLTQSCFKTCFDSVWSQHLVKSQLVSDMQVKTHLLFFFPVVAVTSFGTQIAHAWWDGGFFLLLSASDLVVFNSEQGMKRQSWQSYSWSWLIFKGLCWYVDIQRVCSTLSRKLSCALCCA